METVKVKNVVFGEGMPKICVPMVGRTADALKEETEILSTMDLDVVEWRVDFYEYVKDLEKVKEMLGMIRRILGQVPLLFTFRSKKEGGQIAIGDDAYVRLNREMITTGQVDIIDIELFYSEDIVKAMVDLAHAHGVKVILSNHDFEKTPDKEELLRRFLKMQDLGADLPKIAVMPQSAADVLTLLDATNTMKERYAKRPLISMSMAGQGVISRISGEIFGSAMTFGSAKQVSAPGQMDVRHLRGVLELLHQQL